MQPGDDDFSVSFRALSAAKGDGALRTVLPALFNALTDDCGFDVALRVCREHGGKRIYIPVAFDAEHSIAKACGEAALRTIMRFVEMHDAGDRKLTIPNGRALVYRLRDLRIFDMRERGAGMNEIAVRFDIHRRTVSEAIKRERERRAYEAEQAAKKAARRAASTPKESAP